MHPLACNETVLELTPRALSLSLTHRAGACSASRDIAGEATQRGADQVADLVASTLWREGVEDTVPQLPVEGKLGPQLQ